MVGCLFSLPAHIDGGPDDLSDSDGELGFRGLAAVVAVVVNRRIVYGGRRCIDSNDWGCVNPDDRRALDSDHGGPVGVMSGVSVMAADLMVTASRSTTMISMALGQCGAGEGECQNDGECDSEAFHDCVSLFGSLGGFGDFRMVLSAPVKRSFCPASIGSW